MGGYLFGVPNLDVYLVLGILVCFSMLEVVAGYMKHSQRNVGDWLQETGGFLILSFLIKPLIVILVFMLGSVIYPEGENLITGWSFGLGLLTYLLIDDVLQYWYHRLAHEYDWLWKLHRTHHQAEEMGFFVSYRNAGLYYILMPNIWWLSFFTFFGGAKAVALGLILKQLIVISSHSLLHWDNFFYKRSYLKPIIQILERILITPAFHHAHHGKSMKDGISDPNGNYGNMFSFWDQLFGTATFTHEFSSDLGLQNGTNDDWKSAYFYPFVKSDNPKSELAKGFQRQDTTTKAAATIHLEKGEKYLWCQCGRSNNQPFCDGSHHGTKQKPMVFEAIRTGNVKLCNCKATKSKPFCDNTHLEL